MASKYDPLTTYLKQRAGRDVRMTFAEIEHVLGMPLPQKSKAVRAWWSNNPSNNVMTKAWLAAGYKTAQVDVAGETLVFRPDTAGEGFSEVTQAQFEKVKKTPPLLVSPAKDGVVETSGRHPAFGIWKGKVTLLPDYDYTQPADPDWGKVYDD